jgi:YVTN family beta-propeller protein
MGRATSLLVVLAVAVAGCSRTEPPAPADKASAAVVPKPVAPGIGVYVTNETSGDLTIIDATTRAVVSTIPLGKRPRGIAASPDGSFLYVALSGSPNAGPGVDEKTLPPPDRSADGIGVIDLRQLKLVKVLTGGTDPEVVAVSHDGARAFVANEDAGQLSVIDVSNGRVVETFKTGDEPEGVRVNPSGDQVWVTSEEDGTAVVIDLAAHKVLKTVKVGPRPRSVAFLPDGTRAYVPSENGATLTVVDAKRLVVLHTIALGEGMRPMGTAAASDGRTIYVTTGRSKMVLFVDVASNQVVGSVEAGPRPWGVAVSPDGKTLYTANGPSNDVSVIDVATRQITQKIPAGRGPWGIVVVQQPPAAK